MDSQDNTLREPDVSPTTRRRSAPNHPLATGPNPQDLTFKAIVREAKGFKSFEDSISFTGLTSWRLSQILRKVIRGLRIDPKYKYKVAIWNGELKSTHYSEWERLGNITQLYQEEVPRLRIYRNIRPCNRKKLSQPEPALNSLTPFTRPPPTAMPQMPEGFMAPSDMLQFMGLMNMTFFTQSYLMYMRFLSDMQR